MLNKHIPIPRYENAIFVGDKATEMLSALKIYAKCLVGGDIPSMEILHPQEKLLECTSCAMKDRKHIIDKTAHKMAADYILLEDNGHTILNPVNMKSDLESQGFIVKTLNVNDSVTNILTQAGELFDMQKQAKRVISDYLTRFENLSQKKVKKQIKVLILLGMRRPVTQETFLFAATKNSTLNQSLEKQFNIENVLIDSAELIEAADVQALLQKSPDLIALCGDATCGMTSIIQALDLNKELTEIPAIKHYRMLSLPFYCDAMAWREPQLLEIWAQALELIK